MSSSKLSEKIINFCKKVEPFSFYGFIFFVPISIALSEVFASFTLFFFFVKRWTIFFTSSRNMFKAESLSISERVKELFLGFCRIVKPEKSILNRSLGAFIFVCALSVLFSKYPLLSVQGFFFKVLQWAYLYFVFVEFMKERRQLVVLINVFLVSCTLIFLNGLFQYFIGKDFIFGEFYDGRVFSSFRHANDFGGYLVLACPLILSLVFGKNLFKEAQTIKVHFLKIFFIGIFIAGYFCLGMTLSRGAWLGFFAAIIFLGLSFFYKNKSILIMSLFIIFFFFLSFSGTLSNVRKMSLIAHSTSGTETIIKDLFSRNTSQALSRLSDESDRTLYWRQAVAYIKKSPIFGSGVNTYSRISANDSGSIGGYPHNCYLQMTAEVGFLGIGAFLWMIFILFKTSLQNLRKMNDPFLNAISVGLLSGLFGFLVHSFFDTNFYSVQLGNLMWVVMGAIVATQQIALGYSKD